MYFQYAIYVEDNVSPTFSQWSSGVSFNQPSIQIVSCGRIIRLSIWFLGYSWWTSRIFTATWLANFWILYLPCYWFTFLSVHIYRHKLLIKFDIEIGLSTSIIKPVDIDEISKSINERIVCSESVWLDFRKRKLN